MFDFASAQSVEINWAENDFESHNGDTIEIGSNTDVVFTDFYVVNNSNASSFIWQRKIISHSSTGFSEELCDNQLCHIPTGSMWTCQAPMPVDFGDSTLFQPKLLTNGSGGTGHHRYFILDQTEKMLDSIDVIFNSSLSINNLQLSDNDVDLYPNPSEGDINLVINSDNKNQHYNLMIKDALGKTVYTKNLEPNKKTKITGLNKGVYFAIILSDLEDSIVTKKIVVR